VISSFVTGTRDTPLKVSRSMISPFNMTLSHGQHLPETNAMRQPSYQKSSSIPNSPTRRA
jgi:hypothetical protein